MQTKILKPHPDASDVPGKRVMIEVNGGPERLDSEMLSTSRGWESVSAAAFQIPRQQHKRPIGIMAHSSLFAGET